jgi:hypothetical protein
MRRGARTLPRIGQRAALTALLALASYLLVPYVHVLTNACAGDTASCSSERPQAPTHSPDCGVCGAIAHAGARAADVPVAVAAVAAPLAAFAPPPAHAPFALDRARGVASARGPPASTFA